MKRTMAILGLTLAAGIVLGMLVPRVPTAQQEPLKRNVLQKVDLGEREGTMYVAEIAAGASSGKHFHPGPEAVYILAGSLTLESEGHAARTFKANESFAVPAKHVHEAKNPSETEQVKVLVFLVGDKGQPLATNVTQPYFWKK
jgi:quercetin dioxygenase-like cupin family protein